MSKRQELTFEADDTNDLDSLGFELKGFADLDPKKKKSKKKTVQSQPTKDDTTIPQSQPSVEQPHNENIIQDFDLSQYTTNTANTTDASTTPTTAVSTISPIETATSLPSFMFRPKFTARGNKGGISNAERVAQSDAKLKQKLDEIKESILATAEISAANQAEEAKYTSNLTTVARDETSPSGPSKPTIQNAEETRLDDREPKSMDYRGKDQGNERSRDILKDRDDYSEKRSKDHRDIYYDDHSGKSRDRYRNEGRRRYDDDEDDRTRSRKREDHRDHGHDRDLKDDSSRSHPHSRDRDRNYDTSR